MQFFSKKTIKIGQFSSKVGQFSSKVGQFSSIRGTKWSVWGSETRSGRGFHTKWSVSRPKRSLFIRNRPLFIRNRPLFIRNGCFPRPERVSEASFAPGPSAIAPTGGPIGSGGGPIGPPPSGKSRAFGAGFLAKRGLSCSGIRFRQSGGQIGPPIGLAVGAKRALGEENRPFRMKTTPETRSGRGKHAISYENHARNAFWARKTRHFV